MDKTPNSTEYVTLRRAAHCIGVTPMSLTNWQKEGFPVAVRRRGRAGSRVNLRDAVAWYCQRRVDRSIAWLSRRLQEAKAKAKPSALELERVELLRARRMRIQLETIGIALKLSEGDASFDVRTLLRQIVAELRASRAAAQDAAIALAQVDSHRSGLRRPAGDGMGRVS